MGLHSWEPKHVNYDLILVYKIFNGLIDSNLSSNF